jgi:hypothetical protein
VLKSASNFKAAGWILNNQYNWQYVKDNGAPAAVQGSSITIPGMQNGTYTVNFYSTSTGSLLNSISAAVNSGQLAFALPDIAWDIAFTAAESSVLPVQLYSFSGEKVRKENQLHIDIAEAANVKAVYIERSPDGNKFSTLRQVNADWLAITGKHIFVDEHTLKGNNFYRLKFIDYNGVQSFSQIIKLFNNLAKFSVYPNPFRNYVLVNIEPGNYQFEITDRTGRMFLRKHVNVAGNDHEVKMPLNNICSGVYFLSVVDKFGSQLGYEKIMK